MHDTSDSDGRMGSTTRRRVLAVGGAALSTSLAGCGLLGGVDGQNNVGLAQFRGSGPLVDSRPELSGPRIADLPDLSGTINVYLGGGEGGLYLSLLDLLASIYSDFDYNEQSAPAADLQNTIISETEAGASPADVFLSVDAGPLGAVAEAGATQSLPSAVTDPVSESFRDSEDRWVGFAGRARSIPYNTNQFSESDIPENVMEFATDDRFAGQMGWAPSYSAFQSFITAMRIIEGESATREWINGMQAQNVDTYPDEFVTSNAVANGELGAGFANHYYALRVRSARSSAPLDLAFTRGDAGALVNVSGAAVIQNTPREQLAYDLIRHLLSVEAQEFFATRTFAYPLISGVPPVGGLPSIDELNAPNIDLSRLSDLGATIELLRDTGAL